MRFFTAIVLIAAVASTQAANIPSPSAVIQHLLDTIAALKPEPIAIGPAVIDSVYEPISIGPAIVDFPVEEAAVAPSPESIVEGPVPEGFTDGAPLVQIILNINQAAGSSPVPVSPVVIPETIKPEPVHVVETAPIIPIAVNPIGVVAPEPVQVVETAPVPVEPVIIGTPILPEAAVILPEILN